MAFRAKAMLSCSVLNDRKIQLVLYLAFRAKAMLAYIYFVLGFFTLTNEVQANLWLIDRKKLKTE